MTNSVSICLIFSFLLFSGCSSSVTHNSSGFITAAVKYQKDCESVNHKEREVSCHRLKEGNQFVIAHRDFYRGKGTDSEGFEKLTLYSKLNLEVGHKYFIPNDDLDVFYSHGLSFMPGKGGCYGKAKSGFFEILSSEKNKTVVSLSLDFELKSPLDYQGHCSLKKVTKTFDVVDKSFSDLTPWDGRVSLPINIMAETKP